MFETTVATLWGFAASRLLPAVILLVIGLLAIRLIMTLMQRLLDKSKLEKAAHSLLKSIVRTVLYILLALMVAKSLGIDTTGVIALASVLTLAVSLSVQNALTNVIGGFNLLYTKPFKSGDYIDTAGKSGTVEEIGMTYTRLVTPDIIDRTVEAAYKYRAATAAHACTDTVKSSDPKDFVKRTLDRNEIWLSQSPQVFETDLYRVSAYMAIRDGATATDDCMLAERLGFDVKLVECGSMNLKLTLPEDKDIFEAIIRSREQAGGGQS